MRNGLPQDSPVETLRKQLPHGNGKWPGWEQVYWNLSLAADAMGMSPHAKGRDLHVRTMAVMGTGHEETMKAHQLILRSYGWL
jgi:hypothetical protein